MFGFIVTLVIIGGFLGYVIFGKGHAEGYFQPSGLVGWVIGGVIALLTYRRISGRRSVRA